MLLVILGAGASYDSVPSRPAPHDAHYNDLPNRPPLADQLFDDRQYFGGVMQKYQNCLDIAPRLRHLEYGASIESVLQLYQSEAIEYPERVQQLAAVRYYLQEILTVCPSQWIAESHDMFNHRTLLDDIRRWHKTGERVCFVTFNYDLIIDRALDHAGLRLTDLSRYISSDFMLIKLHGSVNWGRVVATPLPEAILRDPRLMALELIRQAGSINISQDYVMAGGNPPSSRDNRGIFPALAIPVESKPDFECPTEHIDALKSFIPHVTKILIIGWRATEQLFLDMLQKGLRNPPVHVMVVNGIKNYGENAANNIKKLGFSSTYEILEGGFTNFIRNNSGRAFLSA